MKRAGKPSASIPADPVWSGAASRRVDQLTIETFRIPEKDLMANAGEAVAKEAQRHGRNFIVLAGGGNNGGDALIAAEILSQNPENKVQVVRIPREDSNFVFTIPDWADCVLDGVLGLGFKGDLNPESPAAKALRIAAQANLTVIAVDMPSGLDCDDAGISHAPLPADVCVTFGGMKAIQSISPAREICGHVICTDPGFSDAAIRQALTEHPPVHAIVRAHDLLGLNPWNELSADAHKYDRGHVLVIGGSAGKTGATVLAAMSALRSGAGWATVAIPEALSSGTIFPPDLTCESLWRHQKTGDKLDHGKLEKFLASRNVKSIVVGPGTMSSPLDKKSLAVLVDFATTGCVVIDAGALHGILPLLADAKRNSDSPRRIILTPHPGEWRRLAGPADGGKNKETTSMRPPLHPTGCQDLAKICSDLGIHVLYKHATPVLCGPQKFAINPGGFSSMSLVFNHGSNAMGRAGTGDVLTGAIAAHGAIGCDAGFATMRGLSVVARSTELAAAKVGYHAVLPTDIIQELGRAG
jgi:hydroxyethylthiazole kinase-like uncharacterized protein yjeF